MKFASLIQLWLSAAIGLLVIKGSTGATISNYEFASVHLLPQPYNDEILVHVDTQSDHFSLRLVPDSKAYSPDFVLIHNKKEYDWKGTAFKGYVVGQPNSRVIASLPNRRLDAVIFFNKSLENALFIEDGRRYREVDCYQDEMNDRDDASFCTIVYRNKLPGDADHRHNGREKRSADDDDEFSSGMCGWANPEIAAKLKQWMRTEDVVYPKVSQAKPRRVRRAADNKLKVCPMYVQIDYTMWNLYLADFDGDEGQARAAVTLMAADIVRGMNEIYQAETFQNADGSVGPYSNFLFQITRMRIYTKDEVCASNNAAEQQLCNQYVDSDAFLKINTLMDHGKYCLSYIFSHREFSGGVMGLAWLGYPSGYVGGVCQQPTQSGSSQSSYNTGIITSNNKNKRASKRNLMLTLAHEVGHNFEAPHDTTAACTPRGSAGYYLMYPYVNPGTRRNNDEFSQCSKAKIAENIEAVLEGSVGSKPNCFKPDLQPVCGNRIIETGEDCDCGSASECNVDRCCTPQCKFRGGATCSVSNGPCCNPTTCKLFTSGDTKKCSVKTECTDEVNCDGSSAKCPAAAAQPNGTRCESGTRICDSGSCSKSICSKIQYEECQLPFDKRQDSSTFCYLSCQSTQNGACFSSLSTGNDNAFKQLLNDINNGQPLKLPPGSPCANFQGVCDSLGRCRLINTQGPLARLFNALTGDFKADTVGKWLVKYWWVVAIVAVLFIALSFILLKFCSDLLPTSNPKLEGSLRSKDALRKLNKPIRRRRAPTGN